MLCSLCQSDNKSGAKRCCACGASLGVRSGVATGDNGVSSDALPGGTLLVGTYAVESVLGQGGFGITYRCHDRMLDRRVAVKEFFPSGCRRQETLVQPSRGVTSGNFGEARAQFLTEARLLARCHHPGIVGVHAAFEENGTAYMVMELLHGSSVAQLFEARAGQLSEAEAVSIIERTGEALQFVHELGLLHRDIKPENIIVCDDGRVMLIDFGTAREYVQGQSQGHTIVVTPGFAPLEQYAREAQRGAFTDVYGLAATLYFLLTGNVPPAASDRAMGVVVRPVREENPAISQSVALAVEAGLQMQIAKRPQSVRAFLELMHAPAKQEKPAAFDILSTWGESAPNQEGLGVFAAPAPAPFAPVALQPVAPQPPAPQPVMAPRPLFSTSAHSSVAPTTLQHLGGGGIQTKPAARNTSIPWELGAFGLVILGILFLLSLGSSNRSTPPSGFSSSTNPSFNFPSSGFSPPGDPPISPPTAPQTVVDTARQEMESTPGIPPTSVQTLPGRMNTTLSYDAKTPDSLGTGLAEFSPDGGRVAYLDSEGIVRVWSLSKRQVVRSLPQFKSQPPRSMAFSRDGKMLLLTHDKPGVGGSLDRVSLWNLGTGKSLAALDVAPEMQWIHGEAVSSNGQVLVVTGPPRDWKGPSPRLSTFWWNPRTGKRVPAPLQNSADFVHLRLSADGKQFITGDDKGRIRWLDARTGKQKAEQGTSMTYAEANTSPFLVPNIPGNASPNDPLLIGAMRLSGNGAFLSVSNGARIRVFDSNGGETGSVPSGAYTAFAVSPDGKFVAEESERSNVGRNILLWNLRNQQKTKLFTPASGELNTLAFSPDGKQVMGLSSSGGRISLITWPAVIFPSPQFANPQVTSFGRVSFPRATALSSAAQLVATCSNGFIEIHRWDGTLLKKLVSRNLGFWEMAFSPDGQFLAARAVSGDMQLWNVQTNQEVAPMVAMEPLPHNLTGYDVNPEFKSMVFSSDHSLLARAGTITKKNVIEVWTVESTPRRLATIGASERVTALAFSPDKKSLIYGDDKGVLRSVDVATPNNQAQIKNGSSPVSNIVFNPQGMMVVGKGNSSSTITLYGLQHKGNFSQAQKPRPFFQKKNQLSLDGSEGLSELTISPTGRYVATIGMLDASSNRGCVQIWHFPTGALLQRLPTETMSIKGLAFSPDDTEFACFGSGMPPDQNQLTRWRRSLAQK